MDTTPHQPVLVTGATGFIGLHLVCRLVACGYRVSCLVRATSRVDELRALGVELITGHLHDRHCVSRAIALSKSQVVFHLAGLVRTTSPVSFLRVNEEGVAIVAAACAEQTTPPVLLLVSSLAAAGPLSDTPRVEGDPPLPVSNYGRSKLAGERAAARYADVLPITIVRPCITIGPGDRGMLEVFRPIAQLGVHIVPGRGDRRLSLIAVADLVECIVLAAQKGERLVHGGSGGGDGGSGVYFAAAEDRSYVEIGNAIADALGRQRPRVVRLPERLLPLIGSCGDILSRVRGNPGWISRDKFSDVLAGSWTCSSEKSRRELGWSPAATLAERLRETALWYRDSGWL